MKLRLLLPCLLAALLVLPGLRAADQKEKAPPTELETRMEKMNDAWRKLRARGQLDDPAKNADSLGLVATIRQAAGEALQLTPKLAEKKPAAERAKFVADYQAAMKEFLATLDRFAAALKADKNEEAKKIFATLGQMERENHQKFQPPRPPRQGPRRDQPPAQPN